MNTFYSIFLFVKLPWMILVVYINEIRENTLSSKVSKTKWPELCYKTSSLTVTKHVKAGLYNIS